jgi:hypothetical protein
VGSELVGQELCNLQLYLYLVWPPVVSPRVSLSPPAEEVVRTNRREKGGRRGFEQQEGRFFSMLNVIRRLLWDLYE